MADDSVVGVHINCPLCNGVLYVPVPNSFTQTVVPDKLIFDARPSLRGFLIPLLLGLILTPVAGIGLLVIFCVVVRAKRHRYRLTTEELTCREGVFIRREYRFDVKQIRSLLIEQTALERRLRVGRVTVICTHAKLQLRGVRDPGRIKQLIVRTCREHQPSKPAPRPAASLVAHESASVY